MCDTHLKLSQALPLCTCGEDLNRILPFLAIWHFLARQLFGCFDTGAFRQCKAINLPGDALVYR